MNIHNEKIELQALYELLLISSNNYIGGEEWLYSLTWLAACRITKDRSNEDSGVNSLLIKENWDKEIYNIIPNKAKELIWGTNWDMPRELTRRTQALSIVSRMMEQNEDKNWDVIDAPWSLSSYFQRSFMGGLSPELCDLLFNEINPDYGNSIWIPFDPTGQLTIRAVRKGLKVISAGPKLGQSEVYKKLLLVIEGEENFKKVTFDVPLGEVKRNFRADYLIATPPLGIKIQPGAGWRQWEESHEHFDNDGLYEGKGKFSTIRLDKSDSWSIAAFWPRISKKAVFLISPNVLFATGQEQRLRENMLRYKWGLSSVTILPTRQLENTQIATALLVLNHVNQNSLVRFTDASDYTIESKSSMKFSRVMDLKRIENTINGGGESSNTNTSIVLGFHEIAMQDFNLVPARHLRKKLDGNRRSLGELVEVIRAPVISKEQTALIVNEVGFPELDCWREVSGNFAKTVLMNPRKLEDSILKKGDILLSIKGTLGKTALIGRVAEMDKSYFQKAMIENTEYEFKENKNLPVVPSQSCIGLRIRNNQIDEIKLLMFLRSKDFKNQIDSLRVGASVAHVTPRTLMQEIKVPLDEYSELNSYIKKYHKLCELEIEIEAAEFRMNELIKNL